MDKPDKVLMAGVPEGLDALVLARLVRDRSERQGAPSMFVHVARDDRRLEELRTALAFFAPNVRAMVLPAWDCVPYDRVSPNTAIVGRRMSTLAVLAAGKRRAPTIVLTTVNAALQRLPSRDFVRGAVRKLAPGQRIDMGRLAKRLDALGYLRTGTVMEPGEFAVRGGILDLFPPGRGRPVRLDFFGDTLESMRQFDPETQRTSAAVNRLILLPVSEVAFGDKVRKAFRQRYVELFGAVTSEDPLYEAVSAGARYQGMEHWLPLFHEGLETIFEYVGDAPISFDHLAVDAIARRIEQINDHYEARIDALEQKAFGAPPYKPLPPDEMFLDERLWGAALRGRNVYRLEPFEQPESGGELTVVSIGGRRGRQFTAERASVDQNVFDAVVAHIDERRHKGRRVAIACWSNGARERLIKLLGDHGLKSSTKAETWPEVEEADAGVVSFVLLGIEHGFETAEFSIIGEQDILGDRLVRQRRSSRKASDVLTEVASLSVGDLVVHVDHGIGRFEGLKTIEAGGAPHDCLELVYHGGDKLYLPVENIELLTRYGSDEAGAQLDRLGGAAWQSRKARLKQRIRDIAQSLIRVAAMRELKTAPVLAMQEGLFDEFSARFPHEETEDQQISLDAVVADLASGRPMDRLICGDVGFGKTEVALRAAFVAAMNGKQVAVVVPTTLLARQHYRTFADRFQGYPIKIAQASRLVNAKDLAETKAGMASGAIDIVIGTHVLLGKSITFADLGLLIIDEEQHFGVQHKERLKRLRGDVHVVTLTATPIPRTLQLSLSGVRELSLITTPPVDRLAVRTYVTPFDPVILRESLLRERYRGGQTFYVCPRISDLDEIAIFLAETVPELKVAIAHGQLAPGQLDDVMNAFYDGQYDVLLSTTIVESGLDIPSANTLIVHRSDMFGLAQLYQLRGRVGRSKARAYAYFTIPVNKRLTEGAGKRLKVLQSLDTLGAGFSLASHDLDIRGAGNLLGEEQSGHIREVGFELYQSLLEEAVAALKGGDAGIIEDQWSPQISLGTSVLIPESYVSDLQLRLGLYRRLSTLVAREEIDALAAELVDRFGALPEEVRHLLEVVEIKALCRRAGVAQIDAGPKGASLSFRKNSFANPEGLIGFVHKAGDRVKLQPDHKLIYFAEWQEPERRLNGARALVRELAEIAEKGAKPMAAAG